MLTQHCNVCLQLSFKCCLINDINILVTNALVFKIQSYTFLKLHCVVVTDNKEKCRKCSDWELGVR